MLLTFRGNYGMTSGNNERHYWGLNVNYDAKTSNQDRIQNNNVERFDAHALLIKPVDNGFATVFCDIFLR